MKKLHLLLVMLFITAVCANRAYGASGDSKIPDKSFVISLVYVEGVLMNNTYEVGQVYYSTATQSRVKMPQVYEGGNWKYYVPFEENATQIHVQPNEGNAIMAITYGPDEKGIRPIPNGITIYTSDLATNPQESVEVKVYMANESTVRTGTLNITVDDPTGIEVQCRSATDREKFTEADFVDGQLTVKYSPYVEAQWVISRADGKAIAKVALNDTKIQRETVLINTGAGQWTMRPAFIVSTEPGLLNNNVSVTRDFADFDIPVSIVFENDGGNETLQENMRKVISSLSVNGKKVDAEMWGSEDFKVKNGSDIYINFAQQSYGEWEFKERYLNGEKKNNNDFKIEGDDATPQTIVIKGLISTPWRYSFKATNHDQFDFQIAYQEIKPEGAEYDAVINSTQPSVVHVRTIRDNDYKVMSVKLNGEDQVPDERGRYEFFINQQDSKLEIDCQPYLRDNVMPVSLSNDKFNAVDVILNPGGPKEKRIDLTENGTINYNLDDLPLQVVSATSDVYVDNVRQTPDENGNYLAGYTGGNVKFFNKTTAPITLTHHPFPAGINAIITHDGTVVQPGQSYEVAPYTEVKYQITQGSDLVLEYYDRTFFTPEADGTYKIYPRYSQNYKLHKANPYFNINSDQLTQLTAEVQDLDPMDYSNYFEFKEETGTTAKVLLPYTDNADDYTKAYSVVLNVPSRNFKITDVTSTPAGAVFDAATQTVSNIKTGMTLSVSTEANAKPYSLNIEVAVPSGWYSKPSEYDGGFDQWFYLDENGEEQAVDMQYMMPYQLLINGNSASVPIMLGTNNSSTVTMGEEWDFFSLSAEDFPVILTRNIMQGPDDVPIELENLPAKVLINGVVQEFVKGEIEIYGMTQETFYVRIEEPQSFNATCYLKDINPQSVSIYANCEFKYSIDDGELVDVKIPSNPNYPSTYFDIYPQQKISIYPPEGVTIAQAFSNVGSAIDENYNEKNALKREGKAYVWNVPSYYETDEPWNEPKGWENQRFEITIMRPTMTIGVSSQHKNYKIQVANAINNNDGTWTMVRSTQLAITTDAGYRVERVVNDATGANMPFDIRTGVVSGVANGMSLTAIVAQFNRTNKFTLTADNTSTLDNDVKVSLSPGAVYQKDVTLSKRGSSLEVSFSNADLPLQISDITYGGQPASLYYNCSPLPYDPEDGYNFPATIANGSVIRIVKPGVKQTVPVRFVIDPDVAVAITIDGRTYAESELNNGNIDVPAGSAIRIATVVGNTVNYTATYAAQTGSTTVDGVATTAFTVKSTYDNITVTVDKVYNTLTLEGADPDIITVSADGTEYTVGDDNTVKIPDMVTSVKIVTTQDDSYIREISTDAEGATFDVKTGILSGLTTGTYTLDVKKLERDNSIHIQVESDDLGGEIIMAEGAVWQTVTEPSSGFATWNFAPEHLPLIYRPADIDKLPVVYVDGDKVEFDAEKQCFVLADEDYDSKKISVVKLYPWQGEGLEDVSHPRLTYMVEHGIDFEAVEDLVNSITEACTRTILPGTNVQLTVKAIDGDDPVFVELNGLRLDPTDGTYSFIVETADVTVAVQRVKKSITFLTEQWQGIRISGQGMEYPLFDAESTLQFPLATTSVTVTCTAMGKVVSGALDENDNPLNFNVSTGEISGITDNMRIRLVISDYERNSTLFVYLEETEEQAANAVSHLVLATGTHLEASMPLAEGYQEIKIGEFDMPVSFVCTDDIEPVVYLNDEVVEADEMTGAFIFPEELPENSVLKVFTEQQPTITVTYNLTNELFSVAVTHDRVRAIDSPAEHTVLPGTEIALTLTPITQPAGVRSSNAPRHALAAPKVTVNGEELERQQDGTYLIKVTKAHADTGLAIAVDKKEVSTSIDDILAEGQPADVYNLQGIQVLKGALSTDLKRLEPGIYIINGRKVAVNL